MQELVGDRFGDVTALVAGGLAVPAFELGLVVGPARPFDLGGAADLGAGARTLAQAEQPVEADIVRRRDPDQRLGARQAGRFLRQELGHRRPVDADPAGEFGLIAAMALGQRLQPVAKHLADIALVQHGLPPQRTKMRTRMRARIAHQLL